MAKVLVVDDEMTMVQMVGGLLRSEGHQVVPFTDFTGAERSLDSVAPELIIANLSLEKNGQPALGILQKARALDPQPLMIVVTPASTGASTLECIKRGAFDCLLKPFTPDDLKLRVQRALHYQAAVCENASLRKQLQSRSHLPQIVGSSAAIQEVVKVIDRVADSDNPVLIQSPGGAGKQLVARTLHANSRRRFAPFTVLNCGSVPEALLEVELFGQRKPPFAPSHSEQLGLFRETNGGTVLLDDIASLPLALQSRLLTLLQRRQIQVPGDSQLTEVDVRILAATKGALPAIGANMLPDLRHLLSEVTIVLPPLHERTEDIPLLIAHFLTGKIHPRTRARCEISREAVEACRSYPWPGNVRELENALNHACILCENGTIQLSDLPLALQRQRQVEDATPGARRQNAVRTAGCRTVEAVPSEDEVARSPGPLCFNDSAQLVPLKRFLRDQEIFYLQRTLEQVGGSKERAAAVLGISLATMYRKLSEPVEIASDPG